MKLAPRMIQSMEILQMPMQALEARIEQELVSNPTLELREPGADERDTLEEIRQEARDASEGERELVVGDEASGAGQKDDFERLNNLSEEYGETWQSNVFDDGQSFRARRDDGERDGKMDAMANTAARPQSLSEQLLAQWRFVDAPGEVVGAGEYLIGFIDADGYLRTDCETLLKQAPAGITGELLDRALEMLQQNLEPPGLAARDLRECLLLQIDATAAEEDAPDLTVERALVSDHLKDIEANRLPRIAKDLGLDLERVKRAISHLRHFHPHPGRLLATESPRTLQPDAVVEYDEDQDRYVATLTRGRMPSLSISRQYERMVKDGTIDRKTREFVGQNLRSARWLLEAIEQRESTLMRVINVVLDAQRDYFDQGTAALRPLPMTQVADQLGIHVATVSRAVNEKYLQTPRGIVPLRMFFSGGTETETGEQVSWTAVQAKLREVIDAEDKSRPLNDDELVEKLKGKGIDIARRTVAKYRKQMNIAPARQRMEY